MKAPLESEVQKAICDYLALRKYFFWRNNNTPIFNSKTQVFRSMPKYALAGVSDIILLNKGTIWFIEVKRDKKSKQSEAQLAFEKQVLANGGCYVVVSSIDDVVACGL